MTHYVQNGCGHIAFSFSGNLAHCREGYVDAAALLAHGQNVAELLGQALKIAKIVRFEVHAPEAEIDKLTHKTRLIGTLISNTSLRNSMGFNGTVVELLGLTENDRDATRELWEKVHSNVASEHVKKLIKERYPELDPFDF